MGWDDSDDDSDAAAEQILREKLAKEKKAKEEAAAAAKSTAKKGGWDEEEESEDEKPAPKKAESPKAAPKKKLVKKVKVEAALDDPQAEKLRRQKLQEKADARLAADLFDGFQTKTVESSESEYEEVEEEDAGAQKTETIHSFNDVTLEKQADLDALKTAIMKKLNVKDEKILPFPTKQAHSVFYQDLFDKLEPRIEIKDLETLKNRLCQLQVQRKEEKERKELEAKKKKAEEEEAEKKKKDEEKAAKSDPFGGMSAPASSSNAKSSKQISDEDFYADFM